jgi:hypothetical protein
VVALNLFFPRDMRAILRQTSLSYTLRCFERVERYEKKKKKMRVRGGGFMGMQTRTAWTRTAWDCWRVKVMEARVR